MLASSTGTMIQAHSGNASSPVSDHGTPGFTAHPAAPRASTPPTSNKPTHTHLGGSSPASRFTTSASRKSRVALACKRCKRRKQRCDGSSTGCASCDRAGLACTYERLPRPQYPGGKSLYINTLEERVAYLEAQIPGHAEDHLENGLDTMQDTSLIGAEPISASQGYRRGSCRMSQAGSLSEELELDDSTSLVDGVAYLSLCASGTTATVHDPYYVGSSSGATIARVIQSSIFRGSANRGTIPPVAGQKKCDNNLPATQTAPSSPSSGEHETQFPNPEQAKMLFNFFFERIHPRWPLLDRAVYEKLFKKQYAPNSLTIAERSIFHLIYAITARFLSVTRKPCGVDDEIQLVAATEGMDHIVELHNLVTVQFLILLGVHGQRFSYGASAWSQIRFATSVCIEMGLHRRRVLGGSPEKFRDAELRRRAFWSCYCLDRVTSIVLGRAFAIADRDINVELPSANPEFWSLTHAGSVDTEEGSWSNIEPFIHIIRFDRIQSRIHKAVFRVDRDVLNCTIDEQTKLDQKISRLRVELDEWLRTYPQTPKKDNKVTWMYDPESAYLDARDFYGVQYHKAILFLFTIFLPMLDTTDPRFVTCARSAACVCNTYKRLSHSKTLTYTMISLHSCFVAGLTLVYCIWRDRSLFSYDSLEATRACSQILTIFGEKWPGAVKYRDIFDALSGSLFKLTLRSTQTTATLNSSMPLPGYIGRNGPGTGSWSSTPVETSRLGQPEKSSSVKSTLSHLMTDAVKEAFMEVDEEAPGGWQGWRMWNEMVREQSNATADVLVETSQGCSGQPEMSWNAYDDPGFCGIDPIQDATMQMSNGGSFDDSQWTFP